MLLTEDCSLFIDKIFIYISFMVVFKDIFITWRIC